MKYLLLIFPAALMLAGCSALGPNVYSAGEQMRAARTMPATVIQSRSVRIEGQSSNFSVASIAGAVLGGLVGHTVGHGNGKAVATALGAAGDAVGGQEAAKALASGRGYQIVVRTGTGQIVTVVQRAQVAFRAGEPVWLVQSNRGNYRVEPRAQIKKGGATK